jgi:tetratricopeptide (TPR) repeat protein
MKFDVVYYDTVSAPFSRRMVSSRPSGGSELNHVKIVNGLADLGYSVLVLNNLERGEVDGGVVYDNWRSDIVECQTLVVSRFSEPTIAHVNGDGIGISCDRIVMAANDQFQEFQRAKYIPGSTIVLHNQWHAQNFPADWPKAIIPAIVPQELYDLPRVPKDRNKFVYASAVCKGLRATLAEWKSLKDSHPELADAHLYVTTPGHDVLSQETIESYGAHYLGELAPAEVVETLRDAAGLFFVNTLPETFCVIAAIAEALGCRCHVWTRAGGAIAETVRTNLYVASDQVTFRTEFLEAYRTERRGSSLVVEAHNFSPSKVIPLWESVLGLERRAESTVQTMEEPTADAPMGVQLAYHKLAALNVRWGNDPVDLFEKAEHCRMAHMPERALTAYLKCAKLPGSLQHRAYLEAARLQVQLALPEAVETYEIAAAIGSLAEGVECLIELARYHRARGAWLEASQNAGKASNRSEHKSWQALDEFAVALYYIGDYQEQRKVCHVLLDTPGLLPDSERPRVQQTLQFAIDALKAKEQTRYPATGDSTLESEQTIYEPRFAPISLVPIDPMGVRYEDAPSTASGDFIRIHEDAIDGDLCEDFRTLFEAALVCGATHRMDADWRRCTICPLPPPGMQASQKVYERFAEAVRPHVEAYKKLSASLGAVTLIEPPSIILYEPGEKPEHFAEHCDDWNDESATRQISLIAYLNDVHEGGETVFPKLGVTVPPKAGRLLLFPSAFTHVHKAMPPVSGDKFCVVSWLHFPGGKYATIAF